jgi:acyl-CoA thioester hydrolase
MGDFSLFLHKTAIQIRFKDLDALNHVNNANHITYLELARTQYLDDVIKTDTEHSKIGFILARTEIDYTAPIFYRDRIVVYTRTSKIGNKSLEMEYLIVNESDQSVKAKAKTIIVGYDYAHHRPVQLLAEWVGNIRSFEGVNIS